MNRDEIVISILPTLLDGAQGLGQLSEVERRKIFATVGKISYEIADEIIKASKETPNG